MNGPGRGSEGSESGRTGVKRKAVGGSSRWRVIPTPGRERVGAGEASAASLHLQVMERAAVVVGKATGEAGAAGDEGMTGVGERVTGRGEPAARRAWRFERASVMLLLTGEGERMAGRGDPASSRA